MKNLTKGQSRLLAIALLLLVVVLLVRVLLVPLWLSWSESNDRVDALTKRLDVYQRLQSGMASDQKRLAALKADQPTTDWYLDEATPALAAASLQQLLHRQVAQSGGDVVSTQIVAPEGDEPVPTVSVQVRMRAELPQLVDLLYKLEAGRPVLVLDNLAILSNPRLARQATNARMRAQQVPSLDIRFQMTGFAHQEVAP
ncbi:General secretion pathway protein M [Marinobacterium lacunae]|uniref:General secretion pathway protein M n=1 Tax=Marinobacterium lacunae TaxID=1232683 RepID=A0A081FUA0_9GAMM|nr:type II secretion system protein GspM [Marinobacterium lacunae]KEA62105.1 General secretion pathway protein M [Marinobacterium lacunae]